MAEQIQICVSAIRRTLAAGGRPGSIVTRAPGYSIRRVDRELDLLAFEYLVASARRGLARNRLDDAAAGAFRDALRLWRGTVPLAGVRGQLLQSIGAQLVERRLTVVEQHVDVLLRLGRHHELVSELVELVTANPFRERLRAQLMLALYRTERKAEAPQTYRSGRRLFVEELGLEPGAELRRLEWAILADQVGDVLEPGGATTLDIGPLDEREAVELLAEAIGRERVAAESGNIAGWLTCARVSRWRCGWPSAG